jgi:Flp pilus assembly protein TadD
MPAFSSKGERWVLPRWRQWKIARATGELDSFQTVSMNPFRANRERGLQELRGQIDVFDRTNALYVASDVLSSALLCGDFDDPKIIRIAAYVETANDSSAIMVQMARSILRGEDSSSELDYLGKPTSDQMQRRVAELRRATRKEPRNALTWTDLAHAHTELGEVDSAIREMQIAASLAPGNRFVVRSYVRLLVCMDELDRAADLLNSSEVSDADPWIAAARLTTSELAGRGLKSIKVYRRILESGLPPWHISELASALSGTELRNGTLKLAKRLLQISLQDPTENAVAQAEWSAGKGLDVVRPVLLQTPRGYEARALHALRMGEYKDAVRHGVNWLVDQPFALDPALFVSYVASTLIADYETAVKAADKGLTYSPGSPLLLNNRAFALVHMNELEQARTSLSDKVTGNTEIEKACLDATRGLIAYREGNSKEGAIRYGRAIAAFRRINETEAMFMAVIMWAREELRAGGSEAEALIRRVTAMPDNFVHHPELKSLKDRFLASARAIANSSGA